MSVGIGDFSFVNREKDQPSLARTASHQPQPYHPYTETYPGNTEEERFTSPEERAQEVNTIARHLSRHSTNRTVVGENDLFNYNPDSDLDPFSAKFDARKWVKGVSAASRDNTPQRLSGVSFRGLSVHGFGSDAGEFTKDDDVGRGCTLMSVVDYQKTVGNIPLSLLSSVRDLISNRKRKVQILNGIDGVLEAGEMLVVLGPPGR
jgi:ATP-binding cassette subfamily G (WHITE) protein 2 (PDR)